MADALAEIFIWLLGLCIGSFVNVVIYRLPAGLSISNPARSFCPRCQAGIRWYDNVPILSWLLLHARCRQCHAPISVQYPLVEALTGLVFVLTYHLLFVTQARAGLEQPALPKDLPLLLAWLVLAAALIACAAMDLRMYMVDTRITDVALGAAIVLYAIWPRQAFCEARASTAIGAAALAMFLIGIVMLWLTVWRVPSPTEEQHDQAQDAESETAPASRTVTATGLLATAIFVGLAIWLVVIATSKTNAGGAASELAVPLGLLAIFVAIVLIGGQQRAADEEVHNTIEEERPHARRMALRELLWLCPSIAAGLLVHLIVSRSVTVGQAWAAAVVWPDSSAIAPLGGLAFAVHGAVVGAAGGWILRIVFTLTFGREAFGTGDIYILAAAGAVTGWDIVLLGLGLSIGLALAGWALGLLLKRGIMIPFGPWLALGFFGALWLNRAAAETARQLHADFRAAWDQRPELLLLFAGMMLVAFPLAVIIARLIGRGLEGKAHGGQ
jgi:prepilin signal peptidase PulO-like enzyme (type II secretory pathway)